MVATKHYSTNAQTRSILKPDNECHISMRRNSWVAQSVPEKNLSHSREGKKEKSISFGEIQVRRYSQTLGDHPCTSRGPPISLDWQYNQEEPISVDEYESKIGASKTKRKSPKILSDSYRRSVLSQKYGFGQDEIKAAIKERIRTFHQRTQSAKVTPSMKLEKKLKYVRLNTKKILEMRMRTSAVSA
mmetsp:Transcript_13687/g.20839  ORF Transcript_13687/g.20839 Transcript_13687/m.20839 type:complete len:187 (-) Transcript_13687:65-625(-)